MHTTNPRVDTLTDVFETEYREEILSAVHEGAETIEIDWDWLFRHTDTDVTDRLIDEPEETLDELETALASMELPDALQGEVREEAQATLNQMTVRVTGLDEVHELVPGTFSPTDHAGSYRRLSGEVAAVSDVYARVTKAAFECQRCGTMSYIPQSDSDFQEPQECQGCERQGPFRVNHDHSEFVDAQEILLQTPPETAGGTATEHSVLCRGDQVGRVEMGDRVDATGVLHIEQQTSGNEQSGRFEPYLDARRIETDESDHRDIDIDAETRSRIKTLAAGEEGNPLDVAAESFAPRVSGYEHVKKALVLSLVGGDRVEHEHGDARRGKIHTLVLGDPATAKSVLIQRAHDLAWRSVKTVGKGATTAGLTATASQDGIGDSEWTLSPGALVKANRGVAIVDELDDMDSEVRAALLEPMSDMEVSVSKAGINSTLQARTGVLAAGNPKYGRFDPYEPIHEQFDFGSALLSRFDLIFTVRDSPDPDDDADLADHILKADDEAKRGAQLDVTDAPVEEDVLRKWLAIAKQRPSVPFADSDVRDTLKQRYVTLRGANGYNDDEPVPVTARKLEATVRLAEAAARLELCDEIHERHVTTATELVGQSLRDYGMSPDEDKLDADVVETGSSMSQKQRQKTVREKIRELDPKHDDDPGVPIDDLADALASEIDREKTRKTVDRLLNLGECYEPLEGRVRAV